MQRTRRALEWSPAPSLSVLERIRPARSSQRGNFGVKWILPALNGTDETAAGPTTRLTDKSQQKKNLASPIAFPNGSYWFRAGRITAIAKWANMGEPSSNCIQ